MTVRAAIIGLGRWGRSLVNAVHGKTDAIRFTAAYTRTRASAEDYCREKNIPLLDRFEDALASAEIQCIAGVEPVQQSCGKSLCVVGRNDDSGVADDERRIAYVGDDAVTAAGHRFTDDIRESFAD